MMVTSIDIVLFSCYEISASLWSRFDFPTGRWGEMRTRIETFWKLCENLIFSLLVALFQTKMCRAGLDVTSTLLLLPILCFWFIKANVFCSLMFSASGLSWVSVTLIPHSNQTGLCGKWGGFHLVLLVVVKVALFSGKFYICLYYAIFVKWSVHWFYFLRLCVIFSLLYHPMSGWTLTLYK